MSWQTTRDGVLVERGDDATRKVTRWDSAGVLVPSTQAAPNPRPYTTSEVESVDNLIAQAKISDAARELERAIAVSAAPAALAALQALSVPADGSSWRQPQGAHDAYPLGAKVTWKGKTWENLTPANVWEPGVSSWREVVVGGGIAAWVQPTGSTDAYEVGAVVSWKGHKWTSTNAANVWEPGVFGWTDNGVTP